MNTLGPFFPKAREWWKGNMTHKQPQREQKPTNKCKEKNKTQNDQNIWPLSPSSFCLWLHNLLWCKGSKLKQKRLSRLLIFFSFFSLYIQIYIQILLILGWEIEIFEISRQTSMFSIWSLLFSPCNIRSCNFRNEI